jgi:hypothetical protein
MGVGPRRSARNRSDEPLPVASFDCLHCENRSCWLSVLERVDGTNSPGRRHPQRHLSIGDRSIRRHPRIGVPRRNVTPPGQALVLPHRPQPSRSALRGAGSVGDPGSLVPSLTSRPPLLALAAVAPLTASSGVALGAHPIDVRPCGATSAPPNINRRTNSSLEAREAATES